MEASCQCGAVRFTTPMARPLKVYICHCLECRHQSSSAFGMSALFPYFSLPLDSMQHVQTFTKCTSRGGGEEGGVECFFCRRCGCRLIHGGEGQKYVCVKAGCLERLSAEMIRDAVHIWVKRAVVDIPAGAVCYPEEPPDEDLDQEVGNELV